MELFERPASGENAVLVHLAQSNQWDAEHLTEFQLLASSAGANPVALVVSRSSTLSAKYLVGSGKVEEIHQQVEQHQAQLVIVNHSLSPAQERNLEAILKCRVLDRTGLILDIFAQRARSFEGKLQVELAQLQYLSTRLVRGWTHLERQKGGIGLRGPGETQLETDRRLIKGRIQAIHRRLLKVRKQRDQGRQSRKKAGTPTVSLVGYTNAGKSTLFNQLTQSHVLAEDKLFATLDPTYRQIILPGVGALVVIDTVGFVRQLPHHLVSAFNATLEESREADLLLHVIDVTALDKEDLKSHVEDVLEQIEADDVPRLEIYNKIDQAEELVPRIERNDEGKPIRVWLSAHTGAGIELLLQAISETLGPLLFQKKLLLEPQHGHLRAELYAQRAVEKETQLDTGQIILAVKLPHSDFQQLLKKFNLDSQTIEYRPTE